MEQIEPLISSSVAGPIGIAHLPRLWLKILLHGAGLLPEGYRAGEGGFDSSLYEQFGIESAAFIAFVKDERPDYLALEAWVMSHAKDLRPTTVANWNTYVRSANLGPERAAEWRKRFGIADEEFAHGTTLNDLDDWAGFHARLTTRD
jgi:hypothetical protein